MSRRISALFIVAFASAAVACGSSETASQSSGSHLFGDDQCKLDPNQCVPTQPPANGGKCFETTLSASACLNANTWTSVARAACSAQGSDLTATTFTSPCGGATTNGSGQPGGTNGQPGASSGQPDPSGTGGLDPKGQPTQPPIPVDQGAYQGVKLTCCVAVPPPQPPDTCLRIPVAATQVGSDVKSDAVRICADKQLAIRSVEGDATGGLVAICCPIVPPPNACTTLTVGDKSTCASKQSLSDQATRACAQMGQSVSSFSIAAPCAQQTNDPTASGGGVLATVTCCSVPVDNTPVPPIDSNGQKP